MTFWNETDAIVESVGNALWRARAKHNSLGVSGEEVVKKNQFGDTAVRADIECEEAVFEALKTWKFVEIAMPPVRVVSEEHGIVDIGENPRYTGILDGLDGSSVYKQARTCGGRYGTMFAVLNGTDPFYRDYVASGVIEYSKERLLNLQSVASTTFLYFTAKGNGRTYCEDDPGDLGREWRVQTSRNNVLTSSSMIYIDTFSKWERETLSKLSKDFPKIGKNGLGSSAIFYVDLITGKTDVVIECTRKKNLEIGVAYGLVRGAGGVMVDIDGNDLGEKKYLEWGQNEELPVISAANMELARQMINVLKSI
ncbi:hypothetical protein HYS99_00235 [Candidatus Giovannonibacteria bacterium]|nr:hypothetical protein [Candidatus Giovannonibacteria bacterium]